MNKRYKLRDFFSHYVVTSFLKSKREVAKHLFFLKGQIINILGFLGLVVSTATSELCCGNRKTTIRSIQMSWCVFVLIKLYLQKKPVGHGLLTIALTSCFTF